MGVVYKAEDIRLHRTVALKFLPAKIAMDPNIKARFFQEARTASTLDHPNIATIYEIEEAEGQWFIAMAYIEGQNLKDKIGSRTAEEEGPAPLPLDEALDITIQIAEGLMAAHAKGIIHRDIKSSNIMMTAEGQVKITDFGLAKYRDSSIMTKEGTMIGTPAYMSPEQAQCEGIDHRSDIFSLGIVLYELLTGHLPFAGDSDLALLYSIVHQKPEPVQNLAPHVSVELQQIIMKALEKEPAKRYQHMDEMLNDLKIHQSGVTPPDQIQLRTLAARESRKRRLNKALICAGIVCIFIIGYIVLKPLLFQQALESEPLPIAVISFENLTGDRAYDYLQKAIPNLLITSLEQSPSLRVTTWERLNDLLRTMGRENVEIIDKELGFELCRREGIRTIVLGSFIKADEVFATDVKVMDVDSKRILKSASSKGEDLASIIESQIDELSREICLGAGIPEMTIAATQRPIREVTTTSLEAYNYFLRGREDYEKHYHHDARRFLERAVQLDSTFAVAYLYLAWTHSALEDIEARKKAYQKAKTFARKATERERLYIEAIYASAIERNQEKRMRLLTEMIQKFPQEKRAYYSLAHYYRGKNMYDEAIQTFNRSLTLDPNFGRAINSLAYTYAQMGDYEKALDYFNRYASVSPGDANPFDSMAETYFRMGKFDEAIEKYKEALEVKPDFYVSLLRMGYVYALKEEYPEAIGTMDRLIAMAPPPGIEAQGYLWKGFFHYWVGDMNQSIYDIHSAQELAESVGNNLSVAYADWMKGWIQYDRGQYESSRTSFQNWFDAIITYPQPYMPAPSPPFYEAEYNFYLGSIELKNDQLDSSKDRLATIQSLLPDIDPYFKDWMQFHHDMLHGEILLREERFDECIAVCKKASLPAIPYLHNEKLLLYNLPFFKDIPARAYLGKNEPDSAIVEYQDLVTFDPNSQKRYLLHPTYHYHLAMLYEEKSEADKAVEGYKRFIDILENSNPDAPVLIDAKARLAGLKNDL